MKDLMVDIETLSCRKDAVITQIGACYFDRYTGEIGEEFLVNIDIQDCLNKGLKVDAGALKFWFNQPHKDFLDNPNPVSLSNALNKFRLFATACNTAWSHATFDFPILDTAYTLLGQKCVPNHYKHRDIRTLVDLADLGIGKTEKKKDHNALHDCLYQVEYCVQCFNALAKVGSDVKEEVNKEARSE